jgi:carbamoyl-phosphate synthase large subunit
MARPAAKEPVLVTSAGTIVAQGIMKSLRLANSVKDTTMNYRIIAADMSPKAVGLYRSDLGILVPSADSPGYVDAIISLCKEEAVRAVFVGAEEELSPLSEQSRKIERESGALVVADSETISVGRDKWKTFERMKKLGLPCAASSLPEEKDAFVREFGLPMVVKPREGHSSLEVHVAHDRDQIEKSIDAIERAGWRPMLQEYLREDDDEFTSGVTVDREGKKVMSSISMRRVLKNGQTYKAFIDDFPAVRKAAEETALKMGMRGPVNVQARMSGGVPKAFEINPRFSASCPMRAVAGVNEPDIVFRNWVLKEPVQVDSYRKLVCLRYLNEVYVPSSTYEETARSGRTEGGMSFVPDYF